MRQSEKTGPKRRIRLDHLRRAASLQAGLNQSDDPAEIAKYLKRTRLIP